MKWWSICLFLLPSLALAQEDTELNAEFFRPTPGYSVLGVREATLIPHLKFSFEALLNFAQNPVIAQEEESGEVVAEIVSVQTAADVMGAIGIKDVIEFGFAVPVALIQTGEAQNFINAGTSISGSSMGDLRLSAKLKLVGDKNKPEGLRVAFTPEISLPTGNGAELFGASGTSALLALAASYRLPKATVTVNAGPRLQETVSVANLNVGRFLEAGLGGAYYFSDKLSLLGEVNGALSLDDLGIGQSPLEARAGARIKLARNIWLPVGAGVGLTNGFGSPDFRVLLGLSILPETVVPTDEDGDGIFGSDDKCPTNPEDKDEFEDKDGCPEDNDKDGIADADDACPMDAGPAELQGCPDTDGDKIVDKDDKCVQTPGVPEFKGCPDSDKDGIADSDDQCPSDPGLSEFQGCPDKDGDKIADKNDKCPEQAGLAEFQGCPDTDGDKIVDASDKCPTEAEDFDKFEDQDGCPDNDNDQDKIADKDDKCPVDKEDGKGKNPKDGCPDEVKAVIGDGTIYILDKVYFDVNKDTLQKKSYPVLDAVAKVLSEHPEIKKVEIQGHTDDQGKDDYNLDLSDRRAKRVKEYLVKKGIDAGRLEYKGYGETTPLVPVADLDPKKQKKELAAARDQNRRVEFKIVE